MELEGKNFLVIGGAGFIGSKIVSELRKANSGKILIYDNFARGKIDNLKDHLKDSRVEIFDAGGDINHTDILEKSMENIDGAFHLAALWLLQCKDYPRSAFKVNVEGSFNVFEACLKNNIKLVYSSSASVYGDATEEPMTESHPFLNENFYGATKISGEALMTAFCKSYGLKALGLRYMNVYGPGCDTKGAYVGVIVNLIRNILKGEKLVIDGDGKQSFDFVYVDDCAKANLLAMKSNLNSEFFNVGTGVKTSILELAQLIEKISGIKAKVEFNKKNLRPFVTNRIGCTKKAEEMLNFKNKINLEKGLKETFSWISNSRND